MDDYKCPKCEVTGRENFEMMSGTLDSGGDVEYWRCLFCGHTGNAFSQIVCEPQEPVVEYAPDDEEEIGFRS